MIASVVIEIALPGATPKAVFADHYALGRHHQPRFILFLPIYHSQTRFLKRRITLPKALSALRPFDGPPFTIPWRRDDTIAPLPRRMPTVPETRSPAGRAILIRFGER
ncbi:hypothetical protein FQZ97_1156380 [compost metagenome]